MIAIADGVKVLSFIADVTAVSEVGLLFIDIDFDCKLVHIIALVNRPIV
jgi:hypothetical protein